MGSFEQQNFPAWPCVPELNAEEEVQVPELQCQLLEEKVPVNPTWPCLRVVYFEEPAMWKPSLYRYLFCSFLCHAVKLFHSLNLAIPIKLQDDFLMRSHFPFPCFSFFWEVLAKPLGDYSPCTSLDPLVGSL